jgi:hypothetical protein
MITETPRHLTNHDPEATRVRVYFNGIERFDVLEYDVDKGWIKSYVYSGYGRFRQRFPRTLFGTVEVKWK